MQVNIFGNHLDKENPKAEGKGKEVGRVPESTNRMGGGDQPGRHREEEHEDGEEEEQAHGLVANQGALPHLHHHIVEDEQAEQDAQGAEGEEGKSPGSSKPQGGDRWQNCSRDHGRSRQGRLGRGGWGRGQELLDVQRPFHLAQGDCSSLLECIEIERGGRQQVSQLLLNL